MELIAAYPCLGKTTIANMNKFTIFDREFNESRTVIGMSEEQVKLFYKYCADIICIQLEADNFDVLFITENEGLLSELECRGIKPTLVYPDISNEEFKAEYISRVVERSGQAWFDRVIAPEINSLKKRIEMYRQNGYTVLITDSRNPYIEDVVILPVGTILPRR